MIDKSQRNPGVPRLQNNKVKGKMGSRVRKEGIGLSFVNILSSSKI